MEQKLETPRSGLRLALAAAALCSAALGGWCLWESQVQPALGWLGGILFLLTVGLLGCLVALRRMLWGLGELEDITEGWTRTSPEALEGAIAELKGPAGELGASFFRQMRGMEDKLARVEEETRGRAQRDAERRIVRDVRDRLLPRVLADYPNRRNFEISGLAEDSDHPGSTYYDYFFIDPGLLCFSVVQLPQNGVPDVLPMVMAQTMLRGRLWMGRSLADALSEVNTSLFDYGRTTEPVGMLAATLNTASGQVTMVNAGMPAPLMMRSGEGYKWLDLPVRVPLGQMGKVRYQSSELTLSTGSRLLLYTNGLGDMADRGGVPFREQALRATLNRSRTRKESPEQTLRFLADEAEAYCDSASQVQDFSALLLEFRKMASQRHELTVPADPSNVSQLLEMIKTILTENGKSPRDYAPLVVLAEELFTLCCRQCGKENSIALTCGVAPDTQGVTLRIQAPFGGENPLDTAQSEPDIQAAEFIRRQAEYVDFQTHEESDTLIVVWFFP